MNTEELITFQHMAELERHSKYAQRALLCASSEAKDLRRNHGHYKRRFALATQQSARRQIELAHEHLRFADALIEQLWPEEKTNESSN